MKAVVWGVVAFALLVVLHILRFKGDQGGGGQRPATSQVGQSSGPAVRAPALEPSAGQPRNPVTRRANCTATQFQLDGGEWASWATVWSALRNSGDSAHPVKVTVDRAPCPGGRCCRAEVWARPRTSDRLVLQQLFVDDEYAPLFEPHWPPFRFVLDAGANVGYASVLFALFAPEAQIISVEAHPGNFEMLRRNTAAFRNVRPVHAALWGRPANMSVIPGNRRSQQEWQFQVQETSTSVEALRARRARGAVAKGPVALHIPALTVDQLLADFRFPGLDLAKIDVEGAELEVFSGATVHRWLKDTQMLILELHDDMKPGCTAAVERAMRTSGHLPYAIANREYRLWRKPAP